MPKDQAAILQLLTNFYIFMDDHFSPIVRLKAMSIAIETAIDIEMDFSKVLGVNLT